MADQQQLIHLDPATCFKVVCEDIHGFTFSCPYNQRRLDQYVLSYSLTPVQVAETTTTTTTTTMDFLLCFNHQKNIFGFMNQGLFIELVFARNNLYDKIGRLMLHEQIFLKKKEMA
jgi:hypothetical protein